MRKGIAKDGDLRYERVRLEVEKGKKARFKSI